MTVSVLVPYAGDCPHRAAAWEWVQAKYAEQHPEWEICVGGYSGPGWCKGVAVADAASRASGDVFVVADADVWCDTVGQSADIAAGGGWSVPHAKVYRLSEEATGKVYAGARLKLGLHVERAPYGGLLGGGIVCLHRTVWEQAPLDPRFDGWGCEDMAWSLAMQTMVGRAVRLTAPLYHLWHPPQDKPVERYGNPTNRALFRRYQRAHKKRREMIELIEEGRCKFTGSSTATRPSTAFPKSTVTANLTTTATP